MVEQSAVNRSVLGSNPSPGANQDIDGLGAPRPARSLFADASFGTGKFHRATSSRGRLAPLGVPELAAQNHRARDQQPSS